MTNNKKKIENEEKNNNSVTHYRLKSLHFLRKVNEEFNGNMYMGDGR